MRVVSFSNKLNQYRARKIQEIINNKGSDLEGMLQALDDAINEKNQLNRSASSTKVLISQEDLLEILRILR